ncbi:hypothetical protein KSP39_PZI022408 [Platanthera zijinensis]|uniref:Uncharacterized protein n=1 Tax=Platanthera zijinensis TaxID=2320716 RepID=A0AAP0AV02_9ASPA
MLPDSRSSTSRRLSSVLTHTTSPSLMKSSILAALHRTDSDGILYSRRRHWHPIIRIISQVISICLVHISFQKRLILLFHKLISTKLDVVKICITMFFFHCIYESIN